MSNYIILEEQWVDSFYFRFESDHPAVSSAIGVEKISLYEGFDKSVPMMRMSLTDGLGDIMNDTRIAPEFEYRLHVGSTTTDAEVMTFNPSKIEYANRTGGAVEYVGMDMLFLASKWRGLIKGNHSRSWKNKKNSDVASIIAEENGYTSDVDESFGFSNVIQPNWSNSKFLNWMASNSFKSDGGIVGGYMFTTTLDDRLLFKTVDTMNGQMAKKVYVLSYEGLSKDNTFANFQVSHGYAAGLMSGGSGYTAKHFDYDNKSWVNNEVKFSNSNSTQLSDWAFVADEDETADNTYWGGRDVSTPVSASTRNIRSVMDSTAIVITVKGDISLHVGDLINVLIGGNTNNGQIVNEIYSGDWLISELQHDIDFKEKTFTTTLTLNRSGINGVRVKGLTRSSKGKPQNK